MFGSYADGITNHIYQWHHWYLGASVEQHSNDDLYLHT
jgi:hypothetical protein